MTDAERRHIEATLATLEEHIKEVDAHGTALHNALQFVAAECAALPVSDPDIAKGIAGWKKTAELFVALPDTALGLLRQLREYHHRLLLVRAGASDSAKRQGGVNV